CRPASLHSQQAASSGGRAAAAPPQLAGSTCWRLRASASRLRVVCVVDQTAPLGNRRPGVAVIDVNGSPSDRRSPMLSEPASDVDLHKSSSPTWTMHTTTALHEFYNSEVAITEMSAARFVLTGDSRCEKRKHPGFESSRALE
uniref:Kinesin motor domain-containing protein n=1 Tax=Macrostomum lignano TaxID=282301 RepID=A0A1I8FLW8_9PLAT